MVPTAPNSHKDGAVMRHRSARCHSALLALGVAVVVASCTKLTESPFTEVTDQNFNPTAKDIASLIAPI